MSSGTAENELAALRPSVAYFSMEIAIDDTLPTYCGGLGVLAGDHLKAAADLGMPIVGVTLLYRGGYFTQTLDEQGVQYETPVVWSPEDQLQPLSVRATVEVDGRAVVVATWIHWLTGCSGHRVPVVFLDTDLSENDPRDRSITDQIYAGDQAHRLRQEAVLGLAGVAVLQQLGVAADATFHMNEGHSSLLTLALVRTVPGVASIKDAAVAVRGRCVFTTHTPVPEGHDEFPRTLVRAVLGDRADEHLAEMNGFDDDSLNMTVLGMSFSRSVNAVSLLHQEVSQAMFPSFAISSITNGVHVGRWVAPSFLELFDRHIQRWRHDNASLHDATAIPLEEVAAAHVKAKRALIALVVAATGTMFDPDALTLGIARRAAAYKRLDLLLSQPERLAEIVARVGPLQIVYAGKAHPADLRGKEVIAEVHEIAGRLGGEVRVVYLEDYSLEIAAVAVAGSDVWVNTPIRGHEASGTSGMKAALNGVPSLSILDGWWPEGHVEGVTGWAIGTGSDEQDDERDASNLYDALEQRIAPLFYDHPDAFSAIRRATIALNGSYFTAERMVRQYATRAYGLTTSR